jgi:hypothetical protein
MRQPWIHLPGRSGQHLVQPGLGRLTRGGHLPREHCHAGQQYPLAAQPTHRVIEQGHRPLSVSPRPPVEEPRKRLHAARIVERPVAVPVADLPRMLVRRLRAAHVLLQARRVADLELLR